jgi:hypothetical protein
MKFNWGTGILIFLIIFLSACALFIVFASRQQVNLVHKDYYEKGVDYSEQMKVDARSKPFSNSFKTKSTDQFFIVDIDESLLARMDSGTIHMFRPSDKTKDIISAFKTEDKTLTQEFKFDKRALLNGRYILKFTWFSEGVKYEVDRPVNVQ